MDIAVDLLYKLFVGGLTIGFEEHESDLALRWKKG